MTQTKSEIVRICKLLSDKGFVAANDGNVSVRLDDDRLLITPAGVRKGEVTEDMLSVVRLDGNVVEGSSKPSSEILMHSACYAIRDDVHAIVHAHPPYATAHSATHKADLMAKDILIPEILLTTGLIGVVEYFTPGSRELAQATGETLAKHNAVLLKNHGVVTVGRTLAEAFARLESVEMYCKIKMLAESSGACNYLSDAEVQSLLQAKR